MDVDISLARYPPRYHQLHQGRELNGCKAKVRWDSITWDTKHLIIVHLIILIHYSTGTVVVNRLVSDEFRAFYTDMLEFTYLVLTRMPGDSCTKSIYYYYFKKSETE